MLKASFPNIHWDQVKYVAFDMDGTLYDEYENIKQVYQEICQHLIPIEMQKDKVYQFMTSRWQEKGSSYPFIFGEAHDKYLGECFSKDEFIKKALGIYREFSPKIELADCAMKVLSEVAKNTTYELFLVTDGPKVLQENKIKSLNLNQFIPLENMYLTGKYGKEFYKPNIKINEQMKLPQTNEVVYFGDRSIDKEFALKLGWQFEQVFCMERIS